MGLEDQPPSTDPQLPSSGATRTPMPGIQLPDFLGQLGGDPKGPCPCAPLDCTLNLWGWGIGSLEREDLGNLPKGEHKSHMPPQAENPTPRMGCDERKGCAHICQLPHRGLGVPTTASL